jgi:hypothetical protein
VDYALKAVFSIDKLEDKNHTLIAVIAPDSVMLVGWLNYTSLSTDLIATSTTTAYDNELTGTTSTGASSVPLYLVLIVSHWF